MQTKSSLIRVSPVCYNDKYFLNSIPDNGILVDNRKRKVLKILEYLQYIVNRNGLLVSTDQLALLLRREWFYVKRRSRYVPEENSPSRARNSNTTYARKVVRTMSEFISNTRQCFVGNNRSTSVTGRSLGSKDRTSGKDIGGFDTNLGELHQLNATSADDAYTHRKEHVSVPDERFDTSNINNHIDDNTFIHNNKSA